MIYGKKKNNFLDELNTVSKTKDALAQEALAEELKKKQEKEKCLKVYVDVIAQRTTIRIKDRIMDMAKNGDFIQESGKKKIVFSVPVDCEFYNEEYARHGLAVVKRGHILKNTLMGRLSLKTFEVDSEVANKIYNKIQKELNDNGIHCEKITIHYHKGRGLRGRGIKEDTDKYYELKSGTNYYEVHSNLDYHESYELVIQGSVLY